MKFTFIKQLALGDQRLFRGEDGEFYIADNSGYDPDRTDDGPLRLLTDRPIHVGTRFASVSVFKVRTRENKTYHVGMSHEAAINLYHTLRALPEGTVVRGITMELQLSEELNELRELVTLAAVQPHGRG